MVKALVACAWLAAAAAEPTPAPAPPTPAHVYSSDTPIAVVAGEKVTEVSFVATHCVALQRYLEFTLNLPAPPPPLARLELADVPGYAPVETRVVAGTVLVVLRLGDGKEAPALAGEAAAQAWLARVALLAGKATDASEPWTRQALACEVVAQLRPSMNDHWYREGRRAVPATLADILAGKAPAREAFLFWRALRSTLGAPAEQSKTLIASAQGNAVLALLAKAVPSPDEWWLVQRAELLLARAPVSLGLAESAESLDDIARFVFDVGRGDELISGRDLPPHRNLPAVKASVQGRLAGLRREILRQNPVYHNAWRTFGTWLEKFPTAKPEELAALWAQYLQERQAAEELRREIDAALTSPTPVAK
jgi:hypothetical protein